MDVVRHPLDAPQGVAQGAQRPLAGGRVDAVRLQQVEGGLGRAQPVAQLVRQLAAEAAQEARPLPAVPEPLFAKGRRRDGGDGRQRAVEALGHLDGIVGRHLAPEPPRLLPQGVVEDLAQDLELGQDLVDVVALLAPQPGHLAEFAPQHLLVLQGAVGAEVVGDGPQHLGDVVEQGVGGEDAARMHVQSRDQPVEPGAGQLGGAAVKLVAQMGLEREDVLPALLVHGGAPCRAAGAPKDLLDLRIVT